MLQGDLGAVVAGTGEAAVAAQAEPEQALFTKLSPGPGRSASAVRVHQRTRVQNAMVEMVAEQGYREITVRDLVGLAKVSSKAFYSLYTGKEECFLHTHEMLVRRVARSMVTAQAGQSNWRECLSSTFTAFIEELERDPRAARVLLVEAYTAGPESFAQVRRAERTFEIRIADCFERAPGDIEMPPFLVRGIASGMICLTRSRFLEGREGELQNLPGILTQWAAYLSCKAAVELNTLDRSLVTSTIDMPNPPSRRERARGPVGDRALILDAVSKLVLTDGYKGLTVPAICLAAGVSRRRFHLQYADISECFVDAAEVHLSEVFAIAEAAGRVDGSEWDYAIQTSISTLCHSISTDHTLQRLGFGEVLSPGSAGLATCRRTIDRLRRLISATAPDSPEVLAEASAGAIWGLLSHLAIDENHMEPSRMVKAIACLALAPLAAVELSVPSG